MAKYNREFLVPYLRNISSLYFIEQKLQNKIDSLDYSIRKLNEGKPLWNAQPPFHMPVATAGRIISLSFGTILVLIDVFFYIANVLFKENNLDFGGVQLLLGIAGIALILYPICAMSNCKWENRKREDEYKRKTEIDKMIQIANQEARAEVPALQKQLNKYKCEIQKVKTLKEKLYNANIISRNYRDIYTAVYLYDYFSTSQEDDLAMALNTFVLEQIKSKLDIIINNQMEMMLNQSIMIANQERALTQQQDYSARIESKLDQISSSNEERNTYLAMIEGNTAATAYFSAANYIRNI